MLNSYRARSAERVGARFARVWRSVASGRRFCAAWLMDRGVSRQFAAALTWGFVGVVLVAMLYYVFVSLVLLGAAILILLGMTGRSGRIDAGHATPFDWGSGPEGFGVYSQGKRVDPYDPNRAFDPDGGVI